MAACERRLSAVPALENLRRLVIPATSPVLRLLELVDRGAVLSVSPTVEAAVQGVRNAVRGQPVAP